MTSTVSAVDTGMTEIPFLNMGNLGIFEGEFGFSIGVL